MQSATDIILVVIRTVTVILDIRTVAVILGIQTTSYTRYRDWDRDCHSRLGIQITTVMPDIQIAIVILYILRKTIEGY